jgi:hypothetical protein
MRGFSGISAKKAHNLRRQLTHDCLFMHDFRIPPDICGAGRVCRQATKISVATDIRQLPAALEAFGNGQDVCGFIVLDEQRDMLEDGAMIAPVEMGAADAPVADHSAGDSGIQERLAFPKWQLPDQTKFEVVRDIVCANRLFQTAIEMIHRSGEIGGPVAVGVRDQLREDVGCLDGQSALRPLLQTDDCRMVRGVAAVIATARTRARTRKTAEPKPTENAESGTPPTMPLFTAPE